MTVMRPPLVRGQRVQLIRLVRRATGGRHLVSGGGGLAGHFKPDTAVGAGDQDAVCHGPMLFPCLGAYAAFSGLMTAGSNGVRENTSRSIGSKWLSGLVG